MRSISITLSFAVLSCSFIARGQTNRPILYNNAGWNVVGWQMGPPATFPVMADLYKLYFLGDTVINSLVYHKHYYDLDRYSLNNPDLNPIFLQNREYVGAMRDLGLKYYFLPKDSLSERLVYDFSLSIGDTVPRGYFTNQALNRIIYNTSTFTFLDGSIATRFLYGYYVDSTGNSVGAGRYTEGLGDFFALVDPVLFANQYYDGGLSTFSYCENNVVLYITNPTFFPTGNNCEFPSLLSMNNYSDGGIRIYPNPANDIVNICFSLQYQHLDISVKNSYGAEVLHFKSGYNPMIALNITNLANGIYFINIATDKTVETVKMMKGE